MSYSGSMSYFEMIFFLYLYANHLFKRNQFFEFYLNVLKLVALRVLTDDGVTIVISHES